MITDEESQEIWNHIKDFKVAMLTTHDAGALRARPMYRVQRSFDGMLWFIASKSSAKYTELEKNEEVCLTYADADESVFISLSGKAGFTDDRALIKKFWSDFANRWFEQGIHDPDVTLIEVTIEQAEIWDSETNTMKVLYELARAGMEEERPAMAQNKKFNY